MLAQNISPTVNRNSSDTGVNTGDNSIGDLANANQPINPARQVKSNNREINANAEQSPSTKIIAPDAATFSDGLYIGLLIAIALISGTFGGFVNYLLNGEKSVAENEPKGKVPEWAKSIFIGIAAALLVPLFLQTISSQLLREGHSNYLSLLVFAGFCLIAAMSARAFITTLSSKVLQAVEEAKDTAEKARAIASEAKTSAEDAQGTASSARNVALLAAPVEPAKPVTDSPTDKAVAQVDPEQFRDELINEYNLTRKSMKSGWARTAAMTKLLRKMIDLMPIMGELPVLDYINESENLGKRLFGYAYFFHQPNLNELAQLIDSVIEIETTPFGQYWGILAVGTVISENGDAKIDPILIHRLKTFFTKLKPGTDRWKELKNILEQF